MSFSLVCDCTAPPRRLLTREVLSVRRIRLQTPERPLELAVSIYASDSSEQPAQLVASSGPYVDHVCGAVLSAPNLPLAASGEHPISFPALSLLRLLNRDGLFFVSCRLYRHSVDGATEGIRSVRDARLRQYKARGLSVVARAREPYRLTTANLSGGPSCSRS